MVNLSSSGASHIHILPRSATILPVVCPTVTVFRGKFWDQFTKRRYLPMDFRDCNYVILGTNRARCSLNKKILNLLNEDSVSGENSGRASLYREVLPQMFEKVSRLLKYVQFFFLFIYVYGHQHRSLYPARLCTRVINCHFLRFYQLNYLSVCQHNSVMVHSNILLL